MQQTVLVKLTALALSCTLGLAVAGCGGDNEPKITGPTAPPSSLPAAVGTVQGRLLLAGGPAPGSPVPMPGKLTIKGAGSTLHAEIGKDGRFAIQLVPGRYRITATSPNLNDGTMVCGTRPTTTTLTAGKTVTADVVCSVP